MKHCTSFHFTVGAEPVRKQQWPLKDKCTVVAVIGKGDGRRPSGKDQLFRRLIGHSTRPTTGDHNDCSQRDSSAVRVDGFYSTSAANGNTVYLLVHSPLDAACLVAQCRQLSRKLAEHGFLACWADLRWTAARALLWTLVLSHVVLVYSPGHSADAGLLPLLQAADVCRHKLHALIGDRLQGIVGVQNSWARHARLCTPRLLFYCGHSPPPLPSHTAIGSTDSRTGCNSPLASLSPRHLQKQLRSAIQCQLLEVLRRMRCMGGGNAHHAPLFALSSTLPFVHVPPPSTPPPPQPPAQQAHQRQATTTAAGGCHWGYDTAAAMSLLRQLCLNTDRTASELAQSVCPSPVDRTSPRDCSTSVSDESRDVDDHYGVGLVEQYVQTAVETGFDEQCGTSSGGGRGGGGCAGSSVTGRKQAAAQHAHFVLPSARVWYEVACQLFADLVAAPVLSNIDAVPAASQASDTNRSAGTGGVAGASTGGVAGRQVVTGITKVMTNFRAALNVDVRFSDTLCTRTLPVALAAYESGLPTRYSRATHQKRVAAAAAVFVSRARGPACHRYLPLLRRRCDSVWHQGRRMCEQLSLTGNPCINPIHLLPDDGDGSGNGGEDYPTSKPNSDNEVDQERKVTAAAATGSGRSVMEHCSGVRYLATCNCGRTQVAKNDPYSVRYANYEFYERLAQSCCRRLSRHHFPVFVPSAQHTSKPAAAASVVTVVPEATAVVEELGPAEALAEGTATGDHSLSQFFDLQLSQGATHAEVEDTEDGDANSDDDEADDGTEVDEDQECDDPDGQSHSTSVAVSLADDEAHVTAVACSEDTSETVVSSDVEYLAGMLTTTTPPHLLPKYPSFSLVCTGMSSYYSHSAGLHGFVPGSNHLLPWELRFNPDSHEQLYQRSFRQRFGRRTRDDLYAKIFIGFEYECPRGHRFLMAAKDRILKMNDSSVGQLRDSGSALVSTDMPVYFNCLCSCAAKPFVGQLMRLHVVTAKSPVRVTLQVRVQPAGPGTPVYVPQPGAVPIELTPAAYWTLRLPHVYSDGESPVVAPPRREVPASGSVGRLLGDLFGVVIRDDPL